MKLTWFGGMTVRIHIGGKMLVANPADIAGVDREELLSGADRTFRLDGELPNIDPSAWQPPRVGSMLDGGAELAVDRLPGGAVISVAGEPPLLLVTNTAPRVGRWGRDAVVVVLGDDADRLAKEILDLLGPKLIALAGPDPAVERAFQSLGSRLDGTGLVALEPGMALEV